VDVVQADNIGDNSYGCFVTLQQHDKSVNTRTATGGKPQFADHFRFDIDDDKQPLFIMMVDASTKRNLLKTEFKMD